MRSRLPTPGQARPLHDDSGPGPWRPCSFVSFASRVTRCRAGVVLPSVACALTLVVLAAADASAQQPLATRPAAPLQKPVEVRLAMSSAASARFSEPRFRRLLGIELQSIGVLAPGLAGPMGDQVAYVWIDLPQATSVAMEVRVGSAPVARRAIDLSGLGRDVGTRIVAIAVAEMLRGQAHPYRIRRPAPSKAGSAEAGDLGWRAAPMLSWTGGFGAALLPSNAIVLAGSSIGLAFRADRVGQFLHVRSMGGSAGDAGVVRWFETGLGVDYRIGLGASWRLSLGAMAGASAVHLGSVRALDSIPAQRDSWSARAGGTIAVDMRVSEAAWLGLNLEPAVVLRPIPFENATGQSGSLRGFWIGLDLALHIDRRAAGRSI